MADKVINMNKEEKPGTVSADDLRVFNEARSRAEQTGLYLTILENAIRAGQEFTSVQKHIGEKYLIGDNDAIDLSTGVISRKEVK